MDKYHCFFPHDSNRQRFSRYCVCFFVFFAENLAFFKDPFANPLLKLCINVKIKNTRFAPLTLQTRLDSATLLSLYIVKKLDAILTIFL